MTDNEKQIVFHYLQQIDDCIPSELYDIDGCEMFIKRDVEKWIDEFARVFGAPRMTDREIVKDCLAHPERFEKYDADCSVCQVYTGRYAVRYFNTILGKEDIWLEAAHTEKGAVDKWRKRKEWGRV